MITIYKYPIKIEDEQTIIMPYGAELMHAGLDPSGVPCLWARVDTTNPLHPITILIRGTGHEIAEKDKYASHFASFNQGPFMWHVFRRCQSA
jgi:hypothetical protein